MVAAGGCVFCRIVRRELDAPIVWESEQILAFLDHRPLFPGHVLVVPKVHRATLSDLSPEEITAVFTATQRLGGAVERAMKADGFFVAVNNKVSQSVPHLHVHVVPRSKGDGLRGFFWPRHPYQDEAQLEAVRAAIAREAAEAR
jgi:histidine triad (HIT) family protein